MSYKFSIRRFLEDNLDKFKTREEILRACAEACNCDEISVYKKMSELQLLGCFPVKNRGSKYRVDNVVNSEQPAVRQSEYKRRQKRLCVRNKGLAGFRKSFDKSIIVPNAIEEGIDKLLVTDEGEPDWMYDEEFREKCKVPVAGWRRYADQYKDLQVKVDGKIIWGHPDIIEQMREVIAR